MRRLIPNFLKPLVRFIYYKMERKKFFREVSIRQDQNKRIREDFSRDCKRLIVIFSTGADLNSGKENLTGGLMSIVSIYEETKKIKHIHNAEVIICTQPHESLINRYTSFKNDAYIYRPEQIFKYFKSLDYLLIHTICYATPRLESYLEKHKNKISSIREFRINILNQNIRLMPKPQELAYLFEWTNNITQTTAHKSYSTKEIQSKYGFPLHYLSVKGGPDLYNHINFNKKEDLILFSPDNVEKNNEIIGLIKRNLPDFETRIIANLNYQDYLNLVEKAKFVITFGEGLDYYFIESAFTGGVSIALYNKEFFPSTFQNCLGLFHSYDELKDQLIDFIKSSNSSQQHKKTNNFQFNICNTIYNNDNYISNINFFYKNDFTYK